MESKALYFAAGLLGALLGTGCTRIRVDPDCPAEMAVGGSFAFEANETQPGAIPTYSWAVDPPAAGSFDDPDANDTIFEAEGIGLVVVTLTASDGLFVSTAECEFEIVEDDGGGPTRPAVALTVVPTRGELGDEFTLTCASVGDPLATTFTFDQTAGPTVTLNQTGGEATFMPDATGDYTFECVGATQAGDETAPATISVTVSRGGRGR